MWPSDASRLVSSASKLSGAALCDVSADSLMVCGFDFRLIQNRILN